MKKLILLSLCLASFMACKKKDCHDGGNTSGNLVMLKVDYLTHQFEGGKIFNLPNIASDSIPIEAIYKSPGDFGNITLMFGPGTDTVFDGGIIWMGSGTQRIPTIAPTSAFPSGNFNVPLPATATIQHVNRSMYVYEVPSNIADIWSDIKHLGITKEYMDANAHVGLFLYTPSVGVGNPAEWDYFWILYRGAGQGN